MGILINKSDFIGDYELAKNGQDNIDLFIQKYEQQVLSQLFGSALLALFQADLVNKVPATQIYKDIYDPFVKEIECTNVDYIGLKEMVLAYVFFYYSRKNPIKSGVNGAVVNQTEVSSQSNKTFLLGYYNRAVRAYKIARYLLKISPEVYPTYAGIDKEYTSIL